jgi:hypothetical protein
MTVDDFADILRNPAIAVVDGNWYPWEAPRGYRARLRLGDEWYWYSVSDTLNEVSPKEVADAIKSRDREKRSGSYKNGRGFEATVRSGNRWYMLGHGNNRW